MKATTLIYATVLTVGLGGCKPAPDMTMQKQTQYKQTDSESANAIVTVTRIGVFEDDLAYNNRRGVYIIIDNENGKKYLGVSGVGISEIGNHSCGRGCLAQDER